MHFSGCESEAMTLHLEEALVGQGFAPGQAAKIAMISGFDHPATAAPTAAAAVAPTAAAATAGETVRS